MLRTFEEFRDYCKGLQGHVLHTQARARPFTVSINGSALNVTPGSGKPRPMSAGIVGRTLEQFNNSQDWSPGQYREGGFISSYVLAVLRYRADHHQAEESFNRSEMIAAGHSNSFCEVWGQAGWRTESVASALARPDALTRCVECLGAVRLHMAGPNGIPRAHAEHRKGHAGCSLGHYFSGQRSPHPHPVSSPSSSSTGSGPSTIAFEDDESAFPEGRAKYRLHRSLERDGSLPRRVKKERLRTTKKLECEVCSFDFAGVFGSLGEGFIEAHHKDPVHKLDGKTKTKAGDLALVCSNCHRMLHRSDPRRSVEELRELLRCVRTGQPTG